MKLAASKTDESMYLLRRNNKVHGIICVVVNDLCMVGDSIATKEFQKLKERFSFGKWSQESRTFCGRDITRTSEGGSPIHQLKNVNNIEEITIPKDLMDHDLVDAKLITELRSRIGQALYVARESRPDIACSVSMLAQTLPNPCIQDIKDANECIRRWKEKSNHYFEIY